MLFQRLRDRARAGTARSVDSAFAEVPLQDSKAAHQPKPLLAFVNRVTSKSVSDATSDLGSNHIVQQHYVAVPLEVHQKGVHHVVKQLSVGRVQQVPRYLAAEEASQVVLVGHHPFDQSTAEEFLILDGEQGLVSIGEHSELSVVVVQVDIVLTLKTANQQLQAQLGIHHGARDDALPPLFIGLLSPCHPLFIELFNVLLDFVLGVVEVRQVLGVEEPVLGLALMLDRDEARPVVRDGKHNGEHQHLALVPEPLEVGYFIV